MNQLSITNDVGFISLHNPPLNCISPTIIDDLITKLEECEHSRTRAIVMRSSIDGIFSAGVDPQAVIEADLKGRKAIFLKLGALINKFLSLRTPIICDINGPAQAGGAVIAALADYGLIDAQRGKICFSEVKVRLSVPRAIQSLVAAKVGPGKLFELLALGKNIDASEAVQIGLAHYSYRSEEERHQHLDGLLSKIARLDPVPLGQILYDLKSPARAAMSQFEAELGDFSKHLTDEFLGKGLREILANTKR